MKISNIDKALKDTIYDLDRKGFKPFASCDGVLDHHINAYSMVGYVGIF